MLKEARTKKVKQLVCLETIEERINNGKLFILIRLISLQQRVLTKNSVSTLIDHSISDQDFHSKELLSAMVPTMFG
jgi:hypothetical protein